MPVGVPHVAHDLTPWLLVWLLDRRPAAANGAREDAGDLVARNRHGDSRALAAGCKEVELQLVAHEAAGRQPERGRAGVELDIIAVARALGEADGLGIEGPVTRVARGAQARLPELRNGRGMRRRPGPDAAALRRALV
jgi:hypothetical protein